MPKKIKDSDGTEWTVPDVRIPSPPPPPDEAANHEPPNDKVKDPRDKGGNNQ
jgi:hypothetical protein